MKWVLLLAIVVLFLGTCKLSEARANRRNQNGYKNSQRVQLIQKLTKARYDYYIQNTAKETIPFTNDEISQVLDMIQNNPISSSCLISEKCASDFMLNYNFILGKINERAAFLEFQFETNITEQNEQLMTDFAPISNRFQSLSKDVAFKFLQNSQNWDAELKRQLFLAAQGIVFKDPQDVTTLSKLSSKLESIYATAKVCRNKTNGEEECLDLEPGLTSVMQNSRNYSELTWAWKGWHDASGKKMRSIFAQTVEIQNKAARDNNYTDLSEYWIDDFEDPNFESNAADLFAKIKPLYQQVHTYVRHKLDQVYGSNYPKWHDPNLIPAHLLGNMWAQGWDSIFDLVKPFPNVQETNLTEVLIDNGYTTLKMFKEAEKFFVSVNLFEMTPEFWAYSMLEKPKGRDVVCHASATDLYNGRDYRIKMCTVVNDETFSTVHHEMGHIEYYMAYKDQKTIFRTGANSAFHEAIGDTIALSVQTPKHFHAINMIKNASLSFEQDINYLMKMALKKVVFLPFGYLMDKWRWDVFRGRINTSNYNQRWWDMRKEYQGLEPPVPRSEDDFDPGAKYHIASYVPYARYFISHFLQFQFYRSLCKHANHTGPLHTCDFYQSENAGSHLRNMLSLGASKHWSYALKTLTLTETTVSADAILEYFKPLHDWLQEENRKFSNSKTMY